MSSSLTSDDIGRSVFYHYSTDQSWSICGEPFTSFEEPNELALAHPSSGR